MSEPTSAPAVFDACLLVRVAGGDTATSDLLHAIDQRWFDEQRLDVTYLGSSRIGFDPPLLPPGIGCLLIGISGDVEGAAGAVGAAAGDAGSGVRVLGTPEILLNRPANEPYPDPSDG